MANFKGILRKAIASFQVVDNRADFCKTGASSQNAITVQYIPFGQGRFNFSCNGQQQGKCPRL
jgi:hypothetical protein